MKSVAGLQPQVHLARDALLRGQQQRLDVAAHRVEQLPLVHQVAVGLRDRLLDALLAPGEHQLLELAVRGEQHLSGRGLERHAPLGADDGVAEVDAAADAEGGGEALERLDDLNRRERAAVEGRRAAGAEAEHVARGRARLAEGVARQDPGLIGDACPWR